MSLTESNGHIEEKANHDAWDLQQRKTFTKWCNHFLRERGLEIENLEKDLSSGVLLLNLLEIISGKTLRNSAFLEHPKNRLQQLQNLNLSFDFFAAEHIVLVNIGPEDIADGKPKLVLGLIWTLILRFQIQKGDGSKHEEAGKGKSTIKQQLLEWCRSVLAPQGLEPNDFQQSWADGLCFCGLVNVLHPNAVDLASRSKDDAEGNLSLAFDRASTLLGIPSLLDVDDILEGRLDELSVMTYVSYFRHLLSIRPAPAAEPVREAEEAEEKGEASESSSSDDEASNEPEPVQSHEEVADLDEKEWGRNDRHILDQIVKRFEKLRRLQQEALVLRGEVRRLEDEKAVQRRTIARLGEDGKALEAKLQESLAREERLKEENEGLQRRSEKAEAKGSKLENELQQSKDIFAEYKATTDRQLEEQCQESQRAAADWSEKEGQLSRKLEATEQERDELAEKVKDLERRLADAQGQLANMIKNNEGLRKQQEQKEREDRERREREEREERARHKAEKERQEQAERERKAKEEQEAREREDRERKEREQKEKEERERKEKEETDKSKGLPVPEPVQHARASGTKTLIRSPLKVATPTKPTVAAPAATPSPAPVTPLALGTPTSGLSVPATSPRGGSTSPRRKGKRDSSARERLLGIHAYLGGDDDEDDGI